MRKMRYISNETNIDHNPSTKNNMCLYEFYSTCSYFKLSLDQYTQKILVQAKTIEEGIVNLISGDFCLQIDRSTAGKDHSLKELFHICNPHILDRILRSCFTS